ncbi:redoxin domain-containing protein [Halostella litorea]|uniref:redoxin domain-containing protein n=1 Tax=Halostella litorea TaxID=2528831 RepID=UPI001092545F|nr:redoxin domain-containing protein [Halostella litorea]
MLSEGGTAPDFALPGVDGRNPATYELVRSIEDAAATVLAFVPSAHAPVCEDDLRALGASGWANRDDLLVWAVTGDTVFANAAAGDRLGLDFPLLSDRRGSIADAYGVRLDDWHAHRDLPGRALFVVAPDWTVRHARSLDPFETPAGSPFDGVAAALAALGVDVDAPSVEYSVDG